MTDSRRIAVAGIFPHLEFSAQEFERFIISGNFSITQDNPSDQALIDSFVSTPSRYLLEVVRRVAASGAGAAEAILVFNPLLRPPAFLVRIVMASACTADFGTIFRSSNGFPVAYLLDWHRMPDFRYLLLLSCSSTALDQRLLDVAFGRRHAVLDLAFPASASITNGFLFGDYLKPMEWCAAHAIEVLEEAQTPKPEVNGQIDNVPALRLAAFFTHHAGDVLFMSIAANQTEAPLYDEIVIHEDYVPIARKLLHSIPILPVKGAVPFRGGYRREDCHHFLDIAPTLPRDRLYVYCRTTRNYNFTNFHYIDHFRFCIGEPLAAPARLNNGMPTVPVQRQAGKSGDAHGKVLLHFDAGWPLKVYPHDYQSALVRLLGLQGLKVVALDAKSPIAGCETARFTGLSGFDTLLDDVAVVVGMDSFPAHYSAHVRGIPTIHLFSSTHPIHSGTDSASPHLMLQNGERCCPCLGWDSCVHYGGSTCRNFASPQAVADHVAGLLRGGAAATSRLPPSPAEKCPAQFTGTQRRIIYLSSAYLDARRIRLALPLMRAAMIPHTLLTLAGEFVRAVRHEGLRKAVFLTLAFMRRRFASRLGSRS